MVLRPSDFERGLNGPSGVARLLFAATVVFITVHLHQPANESWRTRSMGCVYVWVGGGVCVWMWVCVRVLTAIVFVLAWHFTKCVQRYSA